MAPPAPRSRSRPAPPPSSRPTPALRPRGLLLGLIAAVAAATLAGSPGAAAQPSSSAAALAPASASEVAGPPAPSAAVRPVPGALIRPFQPPPHPYGPGHRGVDLAASPGDPVRAALAGRIAFAGPVAGTGWVTLDHGGGLTTTYGPVDAVGPAGRHLPAGAVLGHLQDAGTHLDWGARLDGAYIDPMALLRRWRAHLVDAGG